MTVAPATGLGFETSDGFPNQWHPLIEGTIAFNRAARIEELRSPCVAFCGRAKGEHLHSRPVAVPHITQVVTCISKQGRGVLGSHRLPQQ